MAEERGSGSRGSPATGWGCPGNSGGATRGPAGTPAGRGDAPSPIGPGSDKDRFPLCPASGCPAQGKPAVSAWATPTSGAAPLGVAFSALPSGGTPPYTYSWDFGDGGGAATQNPSHTYNASGTYTAKGTLQDSGGN